MPEYEVGIAPRYLKRQFEKGVGGSVIKVLTEAVTNTDDSYNALLQRAADAASQRGFGSIIIDFDRQVRSFAIVDQAEGLDDDDMREHFTTYGEESAGRENARTRGLFGKGLRDVLFTQVNGQVKSIKEGKSYVAKFRWRDKDGKEKPTVEIRRGPAVTADLRQSWGVQGNGTRVEFKLREGIPNPQFEKLAERLENFYMLRLITSNPERNVVLRLLRRSEVQDSRTIRYVPPAPNSSAELGTKSWKWKLPEGTVNVSVGLMAFETDMLQGDVGYDDREGGLLVYDENQAVLDLTLFCFDTDPAAARFFGHISLDGIGRVIRQRLNSRTPEEILTETRDGFERKNKTYDDLKKEMEKWLASYVEDERKRRAGGAEGLSAKTKKRHEDAFAKLNSLYRKLLGDATGTGVGITHVRHLKTERAIEFRFATLLLSSGRAYTTHLLVNTSIVPPDELIQVTSDDLAVIYPIDTTTPVPHRTTDNETVVIGVKLEAVSAGETTLRASWGDHETVIVCTVVDEDVPDISAGLAFHPDTIAVPDGERRKVALFADLSRPLSAEAITVESDNINVDVEASGSWDPVTASVVRTSVSITGRGKGQEAFITAKGGPLEAIAVVQVVSKKARPRDGGHFRGYKFQAIDNRKIQAITDSEGFIIVNLLDPTNQMYFGSDSDQAAKKVEESGASQTLLADLVLGECLQQAVQEAYTRGKLSQRLDEVTDIQNYIAEQRFEMGAEIHKLFVTKPA